MCSVEGCNSKVLARGWCSKHYKQWQTKGSITKITCKDFNEIIDCGDYYELVILDKKMREKGRAKIDKDDLEKVKPLGRWCLNADGYVYNRYTNTLMHRLVMNVKEGKEVDHKETGIEFRSDNRKFNLRVASSQENKFNQSKQKSNTSGFKGVSYSRAKKKWKAQIRNAGKQRHLGYFDTPEAASKVYNKAAKELHKEFMHKSLTVTTIANI